MSDSEQPSSSVEIDNKAPNQGAQGVFHAPVFFGLGSLANRERVSRDRNNRKRMLERVHIFWIKGVLEQSLHGTALIALGLHEQSDLTENPWRLILQEVDQPARALPSGIRMSQVYDEAGCELLILGEPGAGKTTLLLELTRDLLARAQQDETHPIPVVFNLSSWAEKRQPLTQWLIEELSSKYQVPRKLGKSWIDAEQILPLLDGLDEIAKEHRAACIHAINAYRREHGLLPLVVCSRSTEYLAQKGRLLIRKAVIVQPLTIQQIEDYLDRAGGQLEILRTALHDDPDLQELITNPLMLSVLTLAYHGKVMQGFPRAGSLEMRQRQVFAIYVERMLGRRGATTDYTLQQTKYWLAWLARQLAQHGQTEFHIERMQPDWLPDSRSRWLYNNVAKLAGGLSVGPLIGAGGSLVVGLSIGLVGNLAYGVFSSLLGKLLVGSIGGLVSALAGALLIRQLNRLPGWLVNGLVVGLVAGLGSWLTSAPINGLYTWLVSGLVGGPVIGVNNRFGGRIGGLGVEIKLPEDIKWSWVNMWRGLIDIGFLTITLVVLLFYVVAGKPVIGCIFGFIMMLVSGLDSGLSAETLDERTFATPNEGIRRAARNSLLTYVIFGLPIGLLLYLTIGLFNGLVLAAIVSLIISLLSGGTACIQHATLRLLLWHSNSIPRNYPRFLDYATERILLRKVGGGYIFIHHLLLDYFASLNTLSVSHSLEENVVDNPPAPPSTEGML